MKRENERIVQLFGDAEQLFLAMLLEDKEWDNTSAICRRQKRHLFQRVYLCRAQHSHDFLLSGDISNRKVFAFIFAQRIRSARSDDAASATFLRIGSALVLPLVGLGANANCLYTNGDNYPYGMPINHYYCEKDGKLYFHGGKRDTRSTTYKSTARRQ